MFGEILQKFAKKSSVTVMVRGLLEHLLNADKIDAWFDSVRQAQYIKGMLFSSVVSSMRHHPSVCSTPWFQSISADFLQRQIKQ